MNSKRLVKAGLAVLLDLWVFSAIGNTVALYRGAHEAELQAQRWVYPPKLKQAWTEYGAAHKAILGTWKQAVPFSVLSLGTGPDYYSTEEELRELMAPYVEGTRTEEYLKNMPTQRKGL